MFRKTGNVSRQRLLKEWIQQGSELQFNDSTFSPHDVATVLKQLLSELPEPLLSHKHYEAHVQIVGKLENRILIKIKKTVCKHENILYANLAAYFIVFKTSIMLPTVH